MIADIIVLAIPSFVIASEAKQSIAALHGPGLLRRYAPRNDEVLGE